MMPEQNQKEESLIKRYQTELWQANLDLGV